MRTAQKAKLQDREDARMAASDWFDSTGLAWIDPSPNMRSLNAALLYPGIGMLEGGKVYSVGRGTDAPFEQIGAEWIEWAAIGGILESSRYSRRAGLRYTFASNLFEFFRARRSRGCVS